MANVLVVEDDRDFCESLERYLAALGHSTRCENDGRSALKTLLRLDPHVILLDLRLPIMDGIAFLNVVRSYLRFKFTPVIVMTGVDDEAILQQLEDLGVEQIFKKGHFEFADLRRAIEQSKPN